MPSRVEIDEVRILRLPDFRSALLRDRVRPSGDRSRSGEIMKEPVGPELGLERLRVIEIAEGPALHMVIRGEDVGLRFVARPVGEHEVVREVDGISRPRDEMIDVSRVPEYPPTVEADPVLDVAQDR